MQNQIHKRMVFPLSSQLGSSVRVCSATDFQQPHAYVLWNWINLVFICKCRWTDTSSKSNKHFKNYY